MYEAQISILVTGIHNWWWTGYGFVDIYFRGDDNLETVECYGESHPAQDPLPGRENLMLRDNPVWRPREYFLCLLQSRLGQVKIEYGNVVNRSLAMIRTEVSGL
jgi:hypothetical protein